MDKTPDDRSLNDTIIDALITYFYPLIWLFRFLYAHMERTEADIVRIREGIKAKLKRKK